MPPVSPRADAWSHGQMAFERHDDRTEVRGSIWLGPEPPVPKGAPRSGALAQDTAESHPSSIASVGRVVVAGVLSR